MRNGLILALVFVVQCVRIGCLSNEVVVRTSKGLIKGYRSGPKHNQIDVFKGIPFAQPPVGKYRFTKPREVQAWDGVLNATHYRAACMSGTAFTKTPQNNTDEDCLYLNVFADPSCTESDCAVVVYIHGGSFYFQSAVMFNEDAIAEKYASHRIIFVIPAYRLGIFGFISIGDGTAAPKNLGFHDLMIALKWVHNEISNFGGDPSRVTVMGHSGGATAVHLLNLSPAVPDSFFQQGISLSSVDLYRKNLSHAMTMEIAYRIKCAIRDAPYKSDEVVKCLREKPAEELISYQQPLTDVEFVDLMFGPEPDGELFTADTIERLPGKSRRHMMLGITKKELAMTRILSTVRKECSTFTGVFGYRTDEVLEACEGHYSYKNGKLSVMRDETRASVFRMASKLSSNNAPVFLYSFEMPHHDSHGGDLNFGMGTHPQDNMSVDEIAMNRIYPQYIRHFVTGGQPDQAWSQFSSLHSNFMWISHETFANGSTLKPHMKSGFYPEEVNLWMRNFAFVELKAVNLRGATKTEIAFHTAERTEYRTMNTTEVPTTERTEHHGAESVTGTTERAEFRAEEVDNMTEIGGETNLVEVQTNFWITVGFITSIFVVAVLLLFLHLVNKGIIRRRRTKSSSNERSVSSSRTSRTAFKPSQTDSLVPDNAMPRHEPSDCHMREVE